MLSQTILTICSSLSRISRLISACPSASLPAYTATRSGLICLSRYWVLSSCSFACLVSCRSSSSSYDGPNCERSAGRRKEQSARVDGSGGKT